MACIIFLLDSIVLGSHHVFLLSGYLKTYWNKFPSFNEKVKEIKLGCEKMGKTEQKGTPPLTIIMLSQRAFLWKQGRSEAREEWLRGLVIIKKSKQPWEKEKCDSKIHIYGFWYKHLRNLAEREDSPWGKRCHSSRNEQSPLKQIPRIWLLYSFHDLKL